MACLTSATYSICWFVSRVLVTAARASPASWSTWRSVSVKRRSSSLSSWGTWGPRGALVWEQKAHSRATAPRRCAR
uniref:Putative secreted protein n=1 Tax=Ixodes ricinus TaxID=34613 RepID=A0A6B0U3W9_IXORI